MFNAGILEKRTINLKVYCFECKRSLRQMYSSVQALFYSGNFIVLPFGFNSSVHCVINEARKRFILWNRHRKQLAAAAERLWLYTETLC